MKSGRTATSDTHPRIRARLVYVGLAFATIALGLIVHFQVHALGATARDVIGDALWAAMMVWWISALVPGRSLGTRSVVALGVCFAVELSQLYHTAALDTLRAGTVGHLILGSGFDPRDLAAYTLGVLAAAACEWSVRTSRSASD